LGIIESSGEHQLEVRSLEKEAKPGRYEVKLIELRQAKEQDKALGEALTLYNEAVGLIAQGKYAEAVAPAERALAIREKFLGENHVEVAEILNELGAIFFRRGDYAQAERFFQRALAISEKVLGEDHLEVARPLNNLAFIYQTRGDSQRAEPLLRRSLAILEKTPGSQHPDVAVTLTNLAGLYHMQGDYVRAESLYQRALAIREKSLPVQHPDVAKSLHNLAFLYQTKGDYVRAEPLYRRVMEINEKVLGGNHPDAIISLNNLASVYQARGKYELAKELYQKALAVREKTLGLDHPDVGVSLNNLAHLYQAQEDLTHAEPLYQRAVATWENALGPDHPQVAFALHNLASVYHGRGDHARARPLLVHALAIREKNLSDHHPDVALSLHGLAALDQATARLAEAVKRRERALEISEFNLAHNLVSGSERQKLAYLALFVAETNEILSLHAQAAPSNPGALPLALTTLVRRKGRVLDVMADTITVLRHRADPQDQQLFDNLTGARAQLANLSLRDSAALGSDARRARLQQLEDQVEKLESDLSARSTAFRAKPQPVTLEAVQSAIPQDAVLVEFAFYKPFDAKTKKKNSTAHYSAYVLASQGEPRWVDLGEAWSVDEAVVALRKTIRDPKSANVRQLARAVDEKVMRPVRTLIGDARRILVSPDGMLNLAPFAALVDEQDRYLIERYSITYLTSGRDLLRLQVPRQNRSEPLVVANPNFGIVTSLGQPADQKSGRVQPNDQSSVPSDFSRMFFTVLPGTAGEARRLKSLLPRATVLTEDQATESALKQARGPNILHIATHGFFLEDVEQKFDNTRGGRWFGEEIAPISELRSGAWETRIENPLLRSGLALAGFNQRRSGDDDGALTAMEAAELDLWGTKLVVLSACDTGVGEVKNGEGVYGLRRALVLAGSESQVMSLWQVSDKHTRDLMIAYYRALLRGEGRGEALRSTQLKMLRGGNQQHPYYWASFIQSGEWANLESKR
jgi:CHAT domain-containing protein/Tfp pilus assembly protein PilF